MPILRRSLLFVFSALALAAPPTTPPATPAIDPDRFLAHIKYLASPEMRGRATGSPELETAADYIAHQFRSIGLKPVEGSSYFQAFPVTTNARLGRENRFEYTEGGKTLRLKSGEGFIPLNFSSRGKVAGAVVFVGYGITAPEYNYDDYKDVDAKGKLVLILRHEPQEFDEHSVFDGKVYTEHSQFWSKATNAKNHGARGVILVSDTFNHRGESDDLEKFERKVGPGDAGIPFVQIKEDVAARWISDAGRNLEEIATAIDRDLKPQSFALPGSIEVRENVDVERAVKTVHNVAGYLPGETDEYAIIGAHYDHLGLGEQYSLAPLQAGTVHPGADDNASGTAGVIELARWFASQPKQKRGILFMTFAGEELGLLGSSFYVNHPELPLAKAVAMINLDMIGRVREGKVYIGGAATGTNFRETLEPVLARYPMHMDFSETTGYGSSDHTSFTTKQVPVLFFFSGLHADYHKPSDTWDKIDAPDAAKLLDLIAEVSVQLCAEAERPQFVRVQEPENPHAGKMVGSAGSGYGPEFGSIPDFAEIPNGVRFADIRPGTPAAQAGLRAGDILVEFDGKPIGNLYDFTYALRSKKPGDMVTVKVLRGTETVTASVLLRQRK
ncbi:MAG TPA: M28 family peptidase [Bryobacteraceae bacterium]|nr:M28 family peptidase [Bryobacteraceae bacterium]